MAKKTYWIILGLAGVWLVWLVFAVFLVIFAVSGSSGVRDLASVISALGGLGSVVTALILAYLYIQQKQTLDKQAEIAETSNKIQRLNFSPNIHAQVYDYVLIMERPRWFDQHELQEPQELSGDLTVLRLHNNGEGLAKNFEFYVDVELSPEASKFGHATPPTTPIKIYSNIGSNRPTLQPGETALYAAPTHYFVSEEGDSREWKAQLQYLLEWFIEDSGDMALRYRLTYTDILNNDENPFQEPYEVNMTTGFSTDWLRSMEDHIGLREHIRHTMLEGMIYS